MTSTTDPTAAVPLHLPAILQNPTSRTLRQVEAHNAQQRERAQARKDARAGPSGSGSGDHSGRGKRFVRRTDNAQFASNPHIVPPSKSDYFPSVPLHSRPLQPSFPPSAIPRSAAVPAYIPPARDPFSSSSLNGAFSTSLKGTRALLRKRGRRVETLVGVVENELRSWLSGQGWDLNESVDKRGHENGVGDVDEDVTERSGWRILDKQLVDVATNDAAGTTTSSQPRSLPERHRVEAALPPLPYERSSTKQLPAILELSRSPAHLTWTVAESFERLVVHLVVRYYDLISWSDDHLAETGEAVRLTHIIQPSLVRPRVPSTATPATPETSDMSGLSSSDRGSSTEASATETETETEAETERGSEIDEEDVSGYSLVPESGSATPSFEDAMAALDLQRAGAGAGAPLERTVSNSSSAYASSEGGSDYSMMGGSMTLPPPPGSTGAAPNGWVPLDLAPGLDDTVSRGPRASPRTSGGAARARGGGGWEEKPTFFEYLYGA
ncbi:hypothetical protein EHS25_009752 [Saitozyma podzolica]|uniref:R3H-associated N-terminal domain-containing protein n=1 Tax=Saitozyma podzolica TaxID=1890683 RepID=A0A427YK32_9TREE|nr:hypothetical protein EHS25_009752 [Saitozyma podzolica]